MKTVTINDDLWAKLTYMKVAEKYETLDGVIQKLYDEYVKEAKE